MAESYVERWAREQKEKALAEKVESTEKVEKKGKVKKNNEDERRKGQETEKTNRSGERDGSTAEPGA